MLLAGDERLELWGLLLLLFNEGDIRTGLDTLVGQARDMVLIVLYNEPGVVRALEVGPDVNTVETLTPVEAVQSRDFIVVSVGA